MLARTNLYRPLCAMSVTVLVIGLAACGSDEDSAEGDGGQVVVYAGGGEWGEAQRVAFFEPFEEETGIEVIPAVAPPAAQVQTSIEAGSPELDVYSIDGNRLAAWEEMGFVAPIDYSTWPDAARNDFAPYEATDNAVPSLIFASQIAYDPGATGGPIETWEDFFDVKQFPGMRSLSDPAENVAGGTLEIALLADGVAPGDLYPLDVDRAFAKLEELRPYITRFWIEGAEPVQALIDSQVSATSAYNGRIDTANQDDAGIESSWHNAILQVNYWMVPEGAENAENAQRFIEFASRPEQQAAFSEAITYSPTNQKAFDHISEERQEMLPTAPAYVDDTVAVSADFWNSEAPSGEPWNVEIIQRWQEWLSK